MRVCSKCNQEKDPSEFCNRPHSNECRECHNEYMRNWNSRNREKVRERHRLYKINNPEKYRSSHLMHCFNISLDDYFELLKKQNNACAICGDTEISIDHRTNKVRNLAVDHDEKTGDVRGLLCSRCNRGLGMFRDSVDYLENAINYLER